MRFNINDMCTVKLTDEGIDILKNYPNEMKYHYDTETKEFCTELWNIMKIFGDEMYMGARPYFEKNEIDIML